MVHSETGLCSSPVGLLKMWSYLTITLRMFQGIVEERINGALVVAFEFDFFVFVFVLL